MYHHLIPSEAFGISSILLGLDHVRLSAALILECAGLDVGSKGLYRRVYYTYCFKRDDRDSRRSAAFTKIGVNYYDLGIT